MRIIFSERALRDYRRLSKELQRKVDKQLFLLLRNFLHPSLRAKKYDEARDIWQARVNEGYRFYFQIRNSTFYIITIIKHPK